MTQHETRETRLTRWPLLSTIPTTNAMLVLVMCLWALTGFCALLFAGLEHAGHVHEGTPLSVPERWYAALEVFTGIVVVQFIGKRGTDSTLWRRGTGDAPPKEGAGG
ncbi:MAG: hypothetical protein ACRD3C_12995 [Vicinamibacterales bacterium]